MENIKTNECVVCGEIVDFLNVKDGVTKAEFLGLNIL